ncbi:cytochrome P450 [Aeromicrobium sp. CTD01-1L150]|uniref:cytochrome P450 n=1 Tax=Aeromicrobium sp. CTD01-1L150 TaxID=3341830 RepID=UPI0035BFC48E
MPTRVITAVRRRALRWALRHRESPVPDVTTLRKLPDAATFPIRRDGIHPVPELAASHRQGPVTHLTSLLGMDVWLVTGHAEAREVLADVGHCSNDMRHLLGERRRTAAEGIGGLGMTDPPEHTRLRGLLTPEFTKRRLARLAETIDATVEDCLDDLERRGPEVDLVPHFGFAVPFQVICDLLGLPDVDREAFHALGTARFDMSQGGAGAFGAATQSREFLIDAVARQRAEPEDGLIGELLREHGDDIDDVELGGLADGVFLGGYETSASMLAMGVHVLQQHPREWGLLRHGAPADVDAVCEELLRLLCPVQVAFPRFVKTGFELGGRDIAEGDVVVVSLAAANRDPSVVTDPDDFTLRGGRNRHLAFGHGLHRCVGAELARMELRAALTGLARRFPDLAPAPNADVVFRELSVVHSIDSMPVRLQAAA